jgi:LmbE family N-acetylglucosaminyl deacetylase
MSQPPPRILILGAHPDDAEYHAGGFAALHCQRGSTVKMVSVTNGAAGHHWRSPEELASLRREEAAASGRVIGAEYEVWEFPDGALMPTLEARRRVIREIRTFEPDLVLTHRLNDYHPDHRAVGQLVQDASYLVTVPLVVPEVPALRRDPVVAYLPDLFTKPNPLRPDAVLDVTPYVDTVVRMIACHQTQVFEWLPYNQGIFDEVPPEEGQRFAWLRTWWERQTAERAERFREALIAAYGHERGAAIRYAEAFEISEYAAALTDADRQRLFPLDR